MLGYMAVGFGMFAFGGLLAAVLCNYLFKQKLGNVKVHCQDIFQEAEDTRGLFMAAFYAGGEGRVTVSLTGKIQAINRAMGTLFNIVEKDYINAPEQSLWHIISGQCQNSAAVARFFTLRSDRKRRMELQLVTGKILRLESTGVHNVMRRQVAELFVFTDVSEEKRGGLPDNEVAVALAGRLRAVTASQSAVLEGLATTQGTVSQPMDKAISELIREMESLTQVDRALRWLLLNGLAPCGGGRFGPVGLQPFLADWSDAWERRGMGCRGRWLNRLTEDFPLVNACEEPFQEGLDCLLTGVLKDAGPGTEVALSGGPTRDGADTVALTLDAGGLSLSKQARAQILDPGFCMACFGVDQWPSVNRLNMALGMALIDAAGGTVSLEQKGDGGHVFKMTFPVARSCGVDQDVEGEQATVEPATAAV